ncbi:MAG: bifunctional pyr operon transcriptional regulator/uracil phosphoribosyltransferase PyrR [Elusimicrobia bacterium]|jgi:pyrimidine operon attenuation protein/uracil phosphoribosyltransferase|nr:bifunctional pyr operon transcriptional regulator/uracil phosphoribosyltransferase PyrR [Elusimicrobiota bacterium]
MTAKRLHNEMDVRDSLEHLAQSLLSQVPPPQNQWVVVGIQRRGVPLAHRLAAVLEQKGVPSLPVGSLDITFYRDDSGEASLHPVVQETNLPFDVTGKIVFLVDDVLFSGRTIRCALDELMDFGRPARVYLVVLADRGHRELPIQADFVGKTIPTNREERVDVHLTEIDGEDAIWLSPPGERKGLKR